MANWLNKTTKDYRASSDPPLAEQADWLRNPTLPAGCSDWSEAVVDGDTLRAPNESELAARAVASLASAKTCKIREIDARTGELIETGSVVINGASISTRLTQQTSLLGIKAALDAEIPGFGFPRPLSCTNGETYQCADLADFVRISGLVLAFVESAKAAGRALRAQVLAATTLEEVAAVEDTR